MKFLKTIFTALLLITTLIAGPGFSSIAQAEGDSAKRIDTLAAATTATVFAETSYQAYGGYNFENGTYWYRDGYPYPGQDRWNEGGWGFTATENYGSYHPDNCNSNIDPDGLCFMTGDRHGYYAPHTYWWCGWYNCYQGTNWYWDYGQRGYIQNGGNLNGQVYSDSSVRRVFYTSNNPSYYPSGPQHNVEVKDIIRGGWTQCWLGSFDDQRTYVEDIKNSCTGEYTIMAASTMDPVLSAPEAQYSALVASGDFVKTTFTLHNPDLISMNSITAKLTDAASGKEYLCSVDISNLDVTQVDAPLECIFSGSYLKHRYNLSISLVSEFFQLNNFDLISNQLVMNDSFQVIPQNIVGRTSSDIEVCAYHAAAGHIVTLRLGGQARNVLMDSNGYGCTTFLLPEKAARQTVRGNFGKVKSIETYLYMPTFKFIFKGGAKPKLTLDAKGLPKDENLWFTKTSRKSGNTTTSQMWVAETMKSNKVATEVDLQPDTYDLSVFVNGVNFANPVLEVVSRSASGGLHN